MVRGLAFLVSLFVFWQMSNIASSLTIARVPFV